MHFATNPLIEVHGDTASGSWSALVTASFAAQGIAMWIAVRYDEDYVRTPEGWRFRTIAVTTKFATPFDGPGWVRSRMPQQAPNARWADAAAASANTTRQAAELSIMTKA